MNKLLLSALLIIAIPAAAQDTSFSNTQWLAQGVYSAAHKSDRLLFFTDTGENCPNNPPDKIVKAPSTYTLVWNTGEMGRICISQFVERSDYETDPATIIAWILNSQNSTLGLTSEDQVFHKTIDNGKMAVTVDDLRRVTVGSAFADFSILKNGSLSELKPSVADVTVSYVASDLSETRLGLNAEPKEYLIEIPTFLQKRAFPILVKIRNGGNTFLFPLFVPAYVEPPPKAK
jgi:hypothetical protein